MAKKIVVLPGDGIGPETMDATIRVLEDVTDSVSELDVQVTEHELLQAIQMIAHSRGLPEEEVLSQFRSPERLSELRAQIRHGKTAEIVRRFAKIEEGPPEKAEDAPADEA